MSTTEQRSWRFPTIFKSVGTSLQPGRLILGLLVVTTLMLGGQIWDGIAPSTVSPRGLEAGAFVDHSLDEQGVLRRAVRRWGTADLAADAPTPAAESVLQTLAAARTKAIESGEGDDAVKSIDRTIKQVDSIRPRGAFAASLEVLSDNLDQFVDGAMHASPSKVYDALAGTFYGLPAGLWHAGQCWFMWIYGLFFLLIVAVGGGALSRMEACLVSAEERLSMRSALQHSLDHWWSFWMALVIPLLLSAVVCGVLLLIGLIGFSIPVLNIIVGLLYGLALLLGFLLVFLLLGYVVGGVLLVPAVAVEHCDGGDAMQRVWAYFLNKPLHMLGYLVTGLVGLVLGLLVVQTVALLTVQWTAETIGASTFNDVFTEAGRFEAVFADASDGGAGDSSSAWTTIWSAGLVSYWTILVWYLVAGWIFSYVMAASTRIYLLMRRACDGQDEHYIWWPGLVPGTLSDAPEPEPLQGHPTEVSDD